MELKTMPNVLKKFERVIKSVDLTKKEDTKEQLYTVTLDRQYKVNGKDTDIVTGKTVKEVRATIRANRLLSAQSKEDKTSKEETKKPSKPKEKSENKVSVEKEKSLKTDNVEKAIEKPAEKKSK